MSQFQIHTIDTAPEAAKEALTAVKNAMAEAEEMAEKEMAKVTGGINIPGLF